jgi:transcriptional regulator with PAS, ATPase and Fis domain
MMTTSASGVSVVSLADADVVIIGRAEHCRVRVADPSVSREHARLSIGEEIAIEDLGSSNGTFVNGRRLAEGERTVLGQGAHLEVGQASVLVRPLRVLGLLESTESTPAEPARLTSLDPTLSSVYAMMLAIAASPVSVLVLGETGVGKDVYTEALVRRSSRSAKPFVRINCAALPESTLEGELFGYERGAFTGAVRAKAGLFEAADGGTLFLDEVGEIPLAMQSKLLRVAESGEVMRLGSIKSRRVDVRFISATNRDLGAMMSAGRFRSDLYFRLNGISVTIPPLRARRDDIPLLARELLSDAAVAAGRRVPALAPGCVRALMNYHWPGNVRELKNVLVRALVLEQGDEIGEEALALPVGPPREALPAEQLAEPPTATARDVRALRHTLKEQERALVIEALNATGGNQSRAAKQLGMSRHTLMKRMEDFGLTRPRKPRA